MGLQFTTILALLDALPRIRLTLALLAVAACLSFYLLSPLSMRRAVSSDYEPQVQNLLAGGGLIGADGEVMRRYPPVYPFLLASIRATAWPFGAPEQLRLFFFATMCIIAATLLLHRIAQMVLPLPGAFLAAALFALHPHVLYGTLLPLSETPFTVLLLASLYHCLRGLSQCSNPAVLPFILCGTCCGLAILTRPIALYLPLVLAGGILIACPGGLIVRVRCLSALLISAVLVLAPWQIWISHGTDSLVLISTAGAPAVRDGFTFNHKRMRQAMPLPEGVEWVSSTVWRNYHQLESVSDTITLVGRMTAERPFAVLQTYAFKAARSWYGTDSQRPWPERLNLVLALLLLVPAVAGVIRYVQLMRGQAALGLLLVAVVIYFWAITTAVTSLARYMSPVLGLLIMFVPIALQPSASKVAPDAKTQIGHQ